MTNQSEAEEMPKRRWLGRRGGLIIATVALAGWLYLLLVNSLIFKSQAVIPLAIVIVIVSFTVASAFVYTMAYPVGPRDRITVKLLLFAFVVRGGIASFVDYTPEAIVDRLTGGVAGHPSLLQLTYVGPIEELIKGIAVVLIGRRVARKSMRNGLLVGAAVGFGFSGAPCAGVASLRGSRALNRSFDPSLWATGQTTTYAVKNYAGFVPQLSIQTGTELLTRS